MWTVALWVLETPARQRVDTVDSPKQPKTPQTPQAPKTPQRIAPAPFARDTPPHRWLKECCGRSPGSRLSVPARLPGKTSSGLRGKNSPMTVAGAAPDFDLAQAGTGFPFDPVREPSTGPDCKHRQGHCQKKNTRDSRKHTEQPLPVVPMAKTALGHGRPWSRAFFIWAVLVQPLVQLLVQSLHRSPPQSPGSPTRAAERPRRRRQPSTLPQATRPMPSSESAITSPSRSPGKAASGGKSSRCRPW